MKSDLMKVPMVILDWEECSKQFSKLTKNMLCAGYQNENYDACQVTRAVSLLGEGRIKVLEMHGNQGLKPGTGAGAGGSLGPLHSGLLGTPGTADCNPVHSSGKVNQALLLPSLLEILTEQNANKDLRAK